MVLKLFPEWSFVNAILLIIYFLVDSYYYKKEESAAIKLDETAIRPLKLEGKRNFIFLLMVVLAVAFLNEQYLNFIHSNHLFKFIQGSCNFISRIFINAFYTKAYYEFQIILPGIQLKKSLICF